MAINDAIREKVVADFLKHFEGSPLVVRSPDRVNIIGEHTDYNNGFVLPAAIDKAVYVAVCPREDDNIRLYAGEVSDRFETTVAGMVPTDRIWPNYLLGVADQLKKRGYAPH